MLVRINHNRVRLVDDCVSPPRRLIQCLRNQPEVPAVSPIHMHSETVPFFERQHIIQRVYRADGCSAQRDHHGAHVAPTQFSLQRFQAHAPMIVGRDLRILQLQHGGDAPVGVVRLLRPHNPPSRRQLPGYPQRLQVSQRAAGGQVAQKLRPSEDASDLLNGFNLHL